MQWLPCTEKWRDPGTRRSTSWCRRIQPCKVVCLMVPLSFYNRSGCVWKLVFSPVGDLAPGRSDCGWHICRVSLSQPDSFLPLLQLNAWLAGVPLVKYSNTNGLWQPAIMRNNSPSPTAMLNRVGQVPAPATLSWKIHEFWVGEDKKKSKRSSSKA